MSPLVESHVQFCVGHRSNVTNPYCYYVPEFARKLIVHLHLDRNKKQSRKNKKETKTILLDIAEMRRLRSLRAIFCSAAWAIHAVMLGRCESFKSSGRRHTPHCKHLLKVPSFYVFFYNPWALPWTAAEHTIARRKRYRSLQDAPSSLAAPPSLMLSLIVPSLGLAPSETDRRFVFNFNVGSSSLMLPAKFAHLQWLLCRACVFGSHLMVDLLYWSSLPQVVALGKNSRGYHYILANLVSNYPVIKRYEGRIPP